MPIFMLERIVIESLVKIGLVIALLMTAAAYLVLLERKIAAWVQMRRGPNRVGIPLTNIRLAGLGQPLADGLKFLFKEEYTPAHVDRVLFTLAPIVILTAALALFAAIPWGSPLPPIPALGITEPVELVVAPALDVGVVYVFALSSMAVYGVILGGWASNNKYSFLGALRSSAQLIAYELPLGLGILGVVLASGSLRLEDIVHRQEESGIWFAFSQPLGALVFLVAAFAEAGRLPFDLPEAEQELVGGYHTEYSGMRLLLFLIAEFLHMVTASFLVVILFLGGWHLWGITGPADTPPSWSLALVRIAVLMTKIAAVILFFMLVRWTWPRFRFDQLMNLAWKVMLPLGMVNLLVVAALWEFARAMPWWILVGAGWCVAVLAWVVAALMYRPQEGTSY
jgi:NADH-quinone oxidoreductase subunit H